MSLELEPMEDFADFNAKFVEDFLNHLATTDFQKIKEVLDAFVHEKKIAYEGLSASLTSNLYAFCVVQINDSIIPLTLPLTVAILGFLQSIPKNIEKYNTWLESQEVDFEEYIEKAQYLKDFKGIGIVDDGIISFRWKD